MESATKCFFCGKEKSTEREEIQKCLYCGEFSEITNSCSDGHFMCSQCAGKDSWQLIEDYCLNVNSVNPVELATKLMKAPQFKMHCPNHHFLVPAVLLATYAKVAHKKKKLTQWLKAAQNRAEKVPGGFCGTHGSCGAAVGTGIFISIVTGATPLSGIEWDLSNSMVSRALSKMAAYGGPRCCKRVTYISLIEAADMLKQRLSIKLEMPEKIECSFSEKNEAECLEEKCLFYPR